MLTARFAASLTTSLTGALVLLAALAAEPAAAEPTHGLSAFGELKYGPDFTHFDYVNPDAPKGGRLALIGSGASITFNSLNPFILRGDAAQGMELVFDTLMARAYDEPDAVYGLVAHSAEVAPDRSSVTFHLRPEARFSDGSPVTAEDVARSFELIKEKGHPFLAQPLRDVTGVEALDAHTVRYAMTGALTRDLPLLIAQLPILSKAHYDEHEFDRTTLTPPLGSGPYAVGGLAQGRNITYTRRDDYWARDLPVNRGRYNFDEVRYEYFRDRTAEVEALKAGAYDLREEFTARTWATEYDIPQVRSGRIMLTTLADDTPSGAQGFFLNMRRDKFSDIRVRRALNMAFDFEWTSRNQFYGMYERTESFFENSPMKAQGAPNPQELALLEMWLDQFPETVFGEAVRPPVSDGSGQDRRLLRQASTLLGEAGWTMSNGRRVNRKGEPFTIEFLLFAPTFERVIAPYIKNLQSLGIQASMRRVDPSQYEARVKDFDFDIVTQRYVIRNTPGAELRNYWSSQAADMPGSRNLSGIRNEAVDDLIEQIIAADSREAMHTAARALDRVLRAHHYWIPQWHKASHNVAHWNKFSWPEVKPKYDRGIIDTWWYDEDKAAALSGR